MKKSRGDVEKQSMKAVVFREYGPPDVLRLEEVDRPVPEDDEVLIRVRAATVATADCEVRGFNFPLWIRFPLRLMFGIFKPRARTRILGQELAGEIEAVGKDVEPWATGDEVFAPLSGFGAHAEYVCVRGSAVMARKPANASFEEAACVTVFALNALHFIRKADIESGDEVLINGAGGGIGTIAVQLAKHLGARVTAVDSAGKLEMLRSIGADHVIDYAVEDFTASGKAYDVILDVHGRSPYSRCIRSLEDNGRYVLANPMLSSMLRGLWSSRTGSKKVLFQFAGYSTEDLIHLAELVAEGKIKPVIDRRYPMEQIVEAHRYVETGRKKGNVVLTIDRPA